MSRADTYKQIADYFDGLSTLFTQLAADSTSASESAAGPAAASAHAAPASFDSAEFEQPEEWSEFTEPARPKQEAVLSECPVHFKPWTVKEGGISKNGKPYSAFWKCNGKNQDGSYCSKKPLPAWVKSHPPENALAAA